MIKKNEILKQLVNNTNNFSPNIITNLLQDGILTIQDLLNIGIPEEILTVLPDFKTPDFNLDRIPNMIPDGLTEIYFWGIPGSGKTCALSAILHYGSKKGLLEIMPGGVYKYMVQLKNIFRGPIGYLPSSTNTEISQFLPFNLRDDRARNHPIAFIELSGEILHCFFNTYINSPISSILENSFNSINNYLKGPNRKLHFFIIDISKDPTEFDANGISQYDYLNATGRYLEKKGIFNKTTDAIYIIATKSDLLLYDDFQRGDKVVEFLKNHYAGFVNLLKEICRKYRINDDKLNVLPFSIGQVYFNSICKFNSKSSENIIRILQNDTAIYRKNSILDFFNS
jgi:hypothetical protein